VYIISHVNRSYVNLAAEMATRNSPVTVQKSYIENETRIPIYESGDA